MRDPLHNENVDESTSDTLIGQILNDFLDRRSRGTAESVSELLAAHPECAEQLRDALETVAEVTPPCAAVSELVKQGRLSQPSDAAYLADLGPYRITGSIGRGGMGIVLSAYEPALERSVALKILRPELAEDEAALHRFAREAKAAAALRNPHIVTVYGVGEACGTRYMAMEHVDGPSLADVIRDGGPLPTDTVRAVFDQLMSGLAAAHDAGLVHRDIKPSNILLDGPEGLVKITDFGLARMVSSQTRMTLPKSVLGTPEYMSPEQARGDEDIDHRTDLYSAGVVLYEMLTGRTPFKADTPSAVIHQILHDEPCDPRGLCDGVDSGLAGLALQLMGKERERRAGSSACSHVAVGCAAPVKRRMGPARRVPVTCAGVAGIALLALFLSVWLGGRRIILDVQRAHDGSGDLLKVLYADGEEVPFDPFPDEDAIVTSCLPIDRDGGGADSFVIGTAQAVDKECVFVFGSDLEHVKSFDLSAYAPGGEETLRRWPDTTSSYYWACATLLVDDLDGEPGDEIVAVAEDFSYAARVTVIDPRALQVRSTFWHIGRIAGLIIAGDYFDDGHAAIVAWGINNKLDGFKEKDANDKRPRTRYPMVDVVMVLDPLNMAGVSPPRTERFSDLSGALPRAYAYMDAATSTNAGHFLPEGESRERIPRPEETAGIWNVRIANEPLVDGTGPRFLVGARHTGAVAGATLTVDRALRLLKVERNDADPYYRTDEEWFERWKLLIQDGRYVDDAESE